MRLINIIIMCIIISFPTSVLAKSKTKCRTPCRAERHHLIKECLDEERSFWNNDNLTEKELNRNCRFLTYYSYLECVDDCMYPQKEAVKFYNEHVEGFPNTKEGR